MGRGKRNASGSPSGATRHALRKSPQATLDAQLAPLRTALHQIFQEKSDRDAQSVRQEIQKLRRSSNFWVSMVTHGNSLSSYELSSRVRPLLSYGGTLRAAVMALESDINAALEGALEDAERAFADKYETPRRRRQGFFLRKDPLSGKGTVHAEPSEDFFGLTGDLADAPPRPRGRKAAQEELDRIRRCIAKFKEKLASEYDPIGLPGGEDSWSVLSAALTAQKRFAKQHLNDAAWSYDPANPDKFRAALIALIEVDNYEFVVDPKPSDGQEDSRDPWTMPSTVTELSDEHVETLARIARAEITAPYLRTLMKMRKLVDPDIDIQKALRELIRLHQESAEEPLRELFGIREKETVADVRYMLQDAVYNSRTVRDRTENRGSRIEVEFSVPEDVMVELVDGELADHVSLIRHVPFGADDAMPPETTVAFRGHMDGYPFQFLATTRHASNETLDALFGPGAANEFSTTHKVKSVVREDAKTSQEVPKIACTCSRSKEIWVSPKGYYVPPTPAHRACRICHPSVAMVPLHKTREGREWLQDACKNNPADASRYIDSTAALRVLEGDRSIPRRPDGKDDEAHYGKLMKSLMAEPLADET